MQPQPPMNRLAVVVSLLTSIVHAYPPHYRHIHTRRADSAWNGQISPGSDTTQLDKVPFTPYWVPFGSSSVDDTDVTHVSYSPATAWTIKAGADYVGGTAHVSHETGAEATFTFRGISVEWYGATSEDGGIAEVFLDGASITAVSLQSSGKARTQQMLFRRDGLAPNKDHVLKIVNLSKASERAKTIEIDAFVIQQQSGKRRSLRLRNTPTRMERRKRIPMSVALERRLKTPADSGWSGTTRLAETGNSGINAMQFAVISDTHALMVDKVEHNLLSVDGHPAWAAIYDFSPSSSGADRARGLDIASNSFCAGGSWLGNGTLINVGGNPVTKDHTGSADFGDVNGLQAIRMMQPCEGDDCQLYEEPERIRMATARWYASVARLSDGSALIMGGSTKGGWINNATTNNPTIEYFPPKNIHGSLGLPIASPFLASTLNANLFPIVFTLPNDLLFVAANTAAILYSWKDNTEQRLPDIPNGVRVTYPMSAGATLLPLTKENGYTPEVLICGGSTIDDTRPSTEISSQEPASDQCVRMVLSEEGIQKGWQVERMPEARHMADLVLMPGGEVLIVNGAQTGVGGYGNVKHQVGQSNADHPAYTPVLYRPSAPEGQRFSKDGMPTSSIARMYHSVASLLPSGEVIIAGSNPNLDRTTVEYPTEYRVETLSPPYMNKKRPSFTGLPDHLEYGQPFTLDVSLPAGASLEDIKVSLMDFGFVTHAIHMNTRLVSLVPSSLSADGQSLTVEGPPSEQIYPPGPGWLYVLVNGVPSKGRKVMVGSGADPPVDEEATQNVLQHTQAIAYQKVSKQHAS